ncbi:dipicolinate synthase subunit A [Clostridia bacterium]|nr:dipicolinate synthase subunit A [Clostridia bacterium]
MPSQTIAILGGDLRQYYLADYMIKEGYDVICYDTFPFPHDSLDFQKKLRFADSLKAALEDARLIVGPMPFSKDGVSLWCGKPTQDAIPCRENEKPLPDAEHQVLFGDTKNAPLSLETLLSLLQPWQILAGGGIDKNFAHAALKKKIVLFDFLEDPILNLRNAALTAEGLLACLIYETPFSLTDCSILLLGFGRCGKEIGKRLKFFTSKLRVFDSNESASLSAYSMGFSPISQEELSGSDLPYDIVINTIPDRILSKEQLMALPKDCVLFDIASVPYGFDFILTEQLQLKSVLCPGIPGRFAPRESGKLLGNSLKTALF